MRLFIAEKPSMAREISKCLPENKNIQKRNGYFIQGDDVVTWVVGHVLHQAEPGDYDDKYIRWRPQELRIISRSLPADMEGSCQEQLLFLLLYQNRSSHGMQQFCLPRRTYALYGKVRYLLHQAHELS